jgi:hypothetical protein
MTEPLDPAAPVTIPVCAAADLTRVAPRMMTRVPRQRYLDGTVASF